VFHYDSLSLIPRQAVRKEHRANTFYLKEVYGINNERLNATHLFTFRHKTGDLRVSIHVSNRVLHSKPPVVPVALKDTFYLESLCEKKDTWVGK
jgi:hypothetical protein